LLDFLDDLLRQEVAVKQRKRLAIAVQVAHFPSVKTLDDFDHASGVQIAPRSISKRMASRVLETL
jgi:hypothetical protein